MNTTTIENENKKTTWICASIMHTCAWPDHDQALDDAAAGKWEHEEPYNECVIELSFIAQDEPGSGMLKKCLKQDEMVLFRVLKVE